MKNPKMATKSSTLEVQWTDKPPARLPTALSSLQLSSSLPTGSVPVQHKSSREKQPPLDLVLHQWRSRRRKGMFFSLSRVKPQTAQWGFLRLTLLLCWRRLDKPYVGLLNLGKGCGWDRASFCQIHSPPKPPPLPIPLRNALLQPSPCLLSTNSQGSNCRGDKVTQASPVAWFGVWWSKCALWYICSTKHCSDVSVPALRQQ